MTLTIDTNISKGIGVAKSEDAGAVGAACLLILVIWAMSVFLIPAILMFVWNATVAPGFGWPTVTYWPVFGITFILSVIGGFFKSSVSSSK